MKARELEAAGFKVEFEVYSGHYQGHDRWLDIGVYKDGKLIEGYQGVKQFGLSDPTTINPREARLGG